MGKKIGKYMAKYYIEINGKKINVILRKFKNTKKIKIFFREDILNVSMPTKTTRGQIVSLLKENEQAIYKQYVIMEEQKLKNLAKQHKWETGEQISYLGNMLTIHTYAVENGKNIQIDIQPQENQIMIQIPSHMQWENEEVKNKIKNKIKEKLKEETKQVVEKRLPYWSNITNISYADYQIRDAVSKFGSCAPKIARLHFSSRIIMLPMHVIDAILVHELCHLVYANHSSQFYELVKQYIPDYDDIALWLKNNGNLIIF